jgi:endoglucanase
MNRREFIKSATTAAALASACLPNLAVAQAKVTPSARKLPRWRGFNLLEKFTKRREGNPPFLEADFTAMAEWGFDFARLPMSYLCWTDPQDWKKLQEAELVHIDQAVECGRKHGVHVNLNFHRAPGYCVNPPKEPKDLWTDPEALETCAFHWEQFAKRYKGIPNERLSFDLLNEPADIKEETYVQVVKRLVEAIRSQDPNRLIIADGLRWGTEPVHGLANLGVGQSTRGYAPMQISHYRANWINGSDKWPEPAWPLQNPNGEGATREKLREQRILPWKKLEEKGVGVHVGEWGAFNHTPHPVALAWMRDCLDLWKEAGWGWALWNFRGGFGILDSDRKDVNYEAWQGHRLDREMLKVLQAG